MHRHTAQGQWALQVLQWTSGMRQATSWGEAESCPGGGRCLKSGNFAMHYHSAQGQWAAELLHCTASLLGSCGEWNSYNLPLQGPVAVGRGTHSTHCLTAWWQWVVPLLQYTASLPGGSGKWSFCNALPRRQRAVGTGTPTMHFTHCLGATGSQSPAMHCPSAWGKWAVEILQCNALPLGGSGQWNSCNELPQYLRRWAMELL